MRYCNCLSHNIIQECETDLGGIQKIFLLNAKDYVGFEEEKIFIEEGAKFYEIDAARNTASLVQNAVNNLEQSYVNSVLTFTVRFHSTNLEDELRCLQLGYFKVLVQYKNGYWKFIDEEKDFFFKQTSMVNNSGVNENDMNGVTMTFELNGHSWGILYEEMPTIDVDTSTEPNWIIIDEECFEQ